MRIPPFIMSKEAGRNRVTLWGPGCSFPCPESRWKGQPVPCGGCHGGSRKRTVRKACRAGEGTLRAPVWGKGGIRDADHGKSYDIG